VNLHQEHHFESAICEHLGRHGWLYAEGDAAHYDRHNALFLPDLLAWVEATQPESWQALAKTHGARCPRCWPSGCASASTSTARWRCCGAAWSWWG
jgi:type I restriction enzyme R subunit